MPVKKKPSAAQLAARAKFVKMVRAKAAAKKAAAKKIIRKPSKIDDLLLLDEIKGRAKKVAAKKVAGLDKITRKGKKTTVHYSRVSGLKKLSGVEPHKAKYFIEYKKSGVSTIEYFDKLPKDLYYAAGYQDPKLKGKAYITRFTDAGTSLIPLLFTKNNIQVKKK
jgi:hypothetical protein